jgi:putative MATE family efflux protein
VTQPGPAEAHAGPASLSVEVLRLSWPVLVEQLLIYCVSLWDTYLAGTISTDATAAIGLAAYVTWLGTLLLSLAGVGATALVARAWGAGRRDEANLILNQSVPLTVGMGLVVFLLLSLAAPTLATLQNMQGERHAIVVTFLRIDAWGYLFTSLTLAGAASLRGAGNMRTPMLVLGIVNILNMLVSSTLVFGFGIVEPWGVVGIVSGTLFANVCGGLIMLAVLIVGRRGLRLRPELLRPQVAEIRRILRIGLPAAVDGILTWIGHFLFMMVIARLATGEREEAIYAAHIIGIRVEALTYLPAVAWGAAAATLVGHALGARDIAKARRIGTLAVMQCSLFGLVAGVLYFCNADRIFHLMQSDPEVAWVGAPALRFLAFFQIPLVILIVYTQALRGAGDTRFPVLFSLLGVMFVRVPLAYFCGIVLEGGLIGAWVGMCSDVSLRAVLMSIRYLRGRWVHISV